MLTAAAGLGVWVYRPLDPALLGGAPAPALVIEDRFGIPLRETRAADGSRRRWVALDAIDPDLIAAFLAMEDRRFHDHSGVDVRAVARAAVANFRAGRVVSGASTITMQLVRLLRPTGRGWTDKIGQALWALRLERQLDKHTILEQYLNRVPLGQGAVGVDAAAALYFGASADALSLGQAALLAGLAQAPSRDNPLVSPGRAAGRRAVALARLRRAGYASGDAVARAESEPVVTRDRRAGFLAPHFTTLVAQWSDPAPDARSRRRTSLDAALQAELEAEVRHTVDQLRDRGGRHAAAVVLGNASGEVLAWVGSPDFWADTAGQVDMVVSRRQPGSTLKPFVYGLAFDRGYTPASILPDIARVYQTSTGPYAPRNYDRTFHGPVRAREALASSYNVPAVELAERLGTASVLDALHRAGFTSLRRGAEYYGLGLALGNGEVTLLELANAYRALAAGGVWRPWRWRAARPGEAVAPGRRVMSEASAALVLDILDDPVARIPGFGIDTPLELPFPVAAKTGTSRHFTDNWAVGTTGNFTVAVWVGNFSGRAMEGVSGVSGAGPLLHRSLLAVARRYDPGNLPTPRAAGASAITVCALSGLRATERCPGTVEWFAAGSAPVSQCDWHGPGGIHLPAEFAEWTAQHRSSLAPAVRHTGAMAGRAPADSAEFRIVSPRDGDRYRVPPGVDARFATVALRAAGEPAHRVRWYIDGAPIGGSRWIVRPGRHAIRAVSASGAVDEVIVDVW